MSKFSPTEAIKSGWQLFKGSFGELWAVYLIAFLVSLIPGLVAFVLGLISANNSDLQPSFSGAAGLVNLVGWVLGMVVTLGIIRVQLDIVGGKKVQIGQIFSEWRKVFWYFLGSLLVGLIVVGGILLLIVPGIIFAIKLQFFSYLVVDEGLGPLAAIKESWKMTKGVVGDLFVFGLLLFMLNLAAVIFLFVGLVVTIPVSALALTYVYKKLS